MTLFGPALFQHSIIGLTNNPLGYPLRDQYPWPDGGGVQGFQFVRTEENFCEVSRRERGGKFCSPLLKLSCDFFQAYSSPLTVIHVNLSIYNFLIFFCSTMFGARRFCTTWPSRASIVRTPIRLVRKKIKFKTKVLRNVTVRTKMEKKSLLKSNFHFCWWKSHTLLIRYCCFWYFPGSDPSGGVAAISVLQNQQQNSLNQGISAVSKITFVKEEASFLFFFFVFRLLLLIFCDSFSFLD